ncbi:N-acetylmannosamine kinase [Vibrio vulnificus]|nr:N-acetylmannosamine kinase [Vibrio vulnificus]
MKVLAIDIGGTKIALGNVVDAHLQHRKQFPTPVVNDATTLAKEILAHCQAWLSDVDAIGISTTGLVSEQGISAINPGTLSFPTPFPLHSELHRLSGKPVKMLNDAQAAAWYEFLQLSPELDVRNMAYITVSTGVGGGLVINQQLHKGKSNFAGHIGHTVLDPNGPLCGCQQRGCVEAIASGNAINTGAQALFGQAISNIELFQLAQHNEQASALIQQSAKAIAQLCLNLKATLDLDLVVIGGGVGLAHGYLARVQAFIDKQPLVFQVKVRPAVGDYDACLLGAAFQFEESNLS